MPNLGHLFCIGAAIFFLSGQADIAAVAATQTEIQPLTVAKQLTLTRAEWSCLAGRLDEYSRSSVDPVLGSVVGCGKPLPEAGASSSKQDSIIRAPVAKDAPKLRPEQIFLLSQAQVLCLKAAIPGILAQSSQTAENTPIGFDLTTACPATPTLP